nr:ATP-dependent DNA helicase [Paraferrimonas sp. SM1919]
MGYRARRGQAQLSYRCFNALVHQQTHLIEAPTGLGKSLAYLIAALENKKNIIISTATKNLQQQLLTKDVPIALQTQNNKVSVAVFKGWQNYLCKQFFEETLHQIESLYPTTKEQLLKVHHWQTSTTNGDLDEYPYGSLQPRLKHSITARAATCLGEQCPKRDNCFYFKAKAKAETSNILIVNHHLLLSHHAQQELWLANRYGVIIDEAHRLPELGLQYLSDKFALNGLWVLSRQLRLALQESVYVDDEAVNLIDWAQQLHEQLQQYLHGYHSDLSARQHLLAWQDFGLWRNQINKLLTGIKIEQQPLLTSLYFDFKHWLKQFDSLIQDQRHMLMLSNLGSTWYLHHLKDDLPKRWQQFWQNLPEAKVLLSATLSVNNNANSLVQTLGLSQARFKRYASIFDYRKSQMLLPQFDSNRDYHEQLSQLVIQLSNASRGRTMVLCTSKAAVEDIAQRLVQASQWPVLVQGQFDNAQLVSKFRLLGNAVLVATRSFWEGIDIKGQSLTTLVIDKIPFQSPYSISAQWLKLQNNQPSDPFVNYYLPQAVLTLRQGVGRLIRSEKDVGLLVLADPRLTSNDYGQTILNNLPPFNLLETQEQAQAFLSEIR